METTPHLRLEDVAHTSADGGRRFDHRLIVAATDREEAIGALQRLESGRRAYQIPDHDSMALEPYVQPLAKYTRDALTMAAFEQSSLAAV